MAHTYVRKGITLFELVVCIAIILIITGVLFGYMNKTVLTGKEAVLRIELKSFRMSLVLYKALENTYPEDLRVLMAKRHRVGGRHEILFGREFLPTVGKDGEGYPLDPFGKRYRYYQEEGVVSSATKGYEDW
jgi:type II secretory pathway pseudopilin PulG